MTDRERLMELIRKAREQNHLEVLLGDADRLIDMPRGCEYLADYLIANGVTVQDGKDTNVPTKWISVKDRLPEEATDVLGITEQGVCHIVHYYKGITNEVFTGFYEFCAKREITHWMPTPQPPKGE